MPAHPTIADWLAAWQEGAALADCLPALRERLVQSGAPVYLHVVGEAELAARLLALRQRAAAFASMADCLAALPLFGVPFVVKDNIDVAGAPTTAACPAFSRVASANATSVQRLLDCGAVWMAKTNLDQFATGLVGTRSPYGAPASIFAADRISGGSSSGSAVAVARGDVPFALGTDTAGSGRIPAAFNGLVGLKPTPGRVSTLGVLPACRSLDCVSIFAHSVTDAATVLALIEGPDAADDYSDFVPGPASLPGRVRMGVPAAMPALEASYASAFAARCAAAQASGQALVEIDFAPLFEIASLLYSGPWVAERDAVLREWLEREPQAIDPVVREVVAKAGNFSATDAFLAQYRLKALARQVESIWQQCDVLWVPSAPNHPRFAEVQADPVGVNARLGQFTNFVNLLGWCALALPAGLTHEGLPFGVTLIARGGMDAALAAFARGWCGEPAPAPAAAWPASAPTLRLAVVGAHLSGLPLNGQLRERGATLERATQTAPHYRLYALAGTTPPKPGLLRVAGGGSAIDLEVWNLPQATVGSFLAGVPSPLSLGTIELADGQCVHGFLCEPWVLETATDISRYGGWRHYLATLNP